MIRRTFAVVLLLLGALGVAIAQPLDGLAPEDAAHVQITTLIQESAALSLPVRVDRALRLTLNSAHDALREGQVSRTVTLLRTFTFEVRGVKRAKRLRADVADALIARAEEAIGALSASR
jgi:hypothetical protein